MAQFQLIQPIEDKLDDLCWYFARAYCPRAGEDPCSECYSELWDQMEDFTLLETYTMVKYQQKLLLELGSDDDYLDTLEFTDRVRQLIREDKDRGKENVNS